MGAEDPQVMCERYASVSKTDLADVCAGLFMTVNGEELSPETVMDFIEAEIEVLQLQRKAAAKRGEVCAVVKGEKR